ncbi:hypothetical protein RJ639_037665 [Escallonia herrerae]|uniref:Bromo domain-containing protein n=1 Tax=Escallonia herrerae TaxID=1293975 RepID=A0AA88WNK7_9ASTE|nr:hypothetical protein RJ639_037665 [Escallonia herrerae]
MDLGTIKANLEKDMYKTAENFSADVRLTFSNAMLYNPPSNDVHLMASKLSDILNARWKSLEGEISKAKKGTGGKLTSGLRKSDSDGALSSLDEENIGSSLGSSTASAATKETCASFHGIQLSPEKALRVAMLNCCFADIISKAEEKTNKLADPMLQEKKRLHTDKEVQIEAAVAAKRRKEEAKMKIQRQREREAARIELEKIKKTVELDNLQSLQMLEVLIAYSPLDREKPLEQLGLFLRKDDMENEDECLEVANSHDDLEEGEILWLKHILMYLDDKVWEHPEEWRPKRFLNKNNDSMDLYKMMAFGGGKRKLTSELDRITYDLGKNHFRSNFVMSRTQYSKSQLITSYILLQVSIDSHPYEKY